MGLYRIRDDSLEPVTSTDFASNEIRERDHLQQMLSRMIELVVPGAMVLAEEFSDWADSNRRIDLLCLDDNANLVVVELKRGRTGGHMDLQAIRYAAMVSNMTFERAVVAHERYLASRGKDADAEQRILEFLGWDEADEERFAREVRIVLVAADFSTEVTTAALWLTGQGIDIRCVRMSPYTFDGELLVSIEQVIPLPTAEEFRVRLNEKSASVRAERATAKQATGYFFVNTGEEEDNEANLRSWMLCKRYQFISAGGGPKWVRSIRRLAAGDRVLVYRKGRGYVGAAIVTEPAVRRDEFTPEGQSRTLSEILAQDHGAQPGRDRLSDDDHAEWCARVRWVKALAGDDAVPGQAQRHAVCQIRDPGVVREVLESMGVAESDWCE